ncbi:MAG: hypothetical protein Q9173_005784 [Seirophora scorigena]
MLAVRGKLDKIRKIPSLWDEVHGWDRNAVDTWLLSLGVDNLEALVRVRIEDLQSIPQENRQKFLEAVQSPSIIRATTGARRDTQNESTIIGGKHVLDRSTAESP